MVSAGEISEAVRADGMITRDELLASDSRYTLFGVSALEKWGAVRKAHGTVGGNIDRIEISGFEGVEWDSSSSADRRRAQKELVEQLSQEFVFPILRDGGQKSSRSGVTSSDKRRLEFADDVESEADNLQREVDRFSSSSSSSSSSSTGWGSTKLLGLAAAAALLGYGALQ
jgi:hypothetical protein